MADQRKITLRPGHATPATIILRDLPAPNAPVTTKIYLYEGHATPSTIILGDPTVIRPGGGGGGTAYTLTANAGSYAISGQSATLVRGRVLTCQAGAYVISGQSATLAVGRVLTCQAGAYTISGQSATLVHNRILTCEAGSYVIAGQDATLVHNRVLTCEAGAYNISGQSANLVYAAAATPGIILRPDRPSKRRKTAGPSKGRDEPIERQHVESHHKPAKRIAVVKSVPDRLEAAPAYVPVEMPANAAGTARFWGVADLSVDAHLRAQGGVKFGGRASLRADSKLNAYGDAQFGGSAHLRVIPNDDEEALAIAMLLLLNSK